MSKLTFICDERISADVWNRSDRQLPSKALQRSLQRFGLPAESRGLGESKFWLEKSVVIFWFQTILVIAATIPWYFQMPVCTETTPPATRKALTAFYYSASVGAIIALIALLVLVIIDEERRLVELYFLLVYSIILILLAILLISYVGFNPPKNKKIPRNEQEATPSEILSSGPTESSGSNPGADQEEMGEERKKRDVLNLIRLKRQKNDYYDDDAEVGGDTSDKPKVPANTTSTPDTEIEEPVSTIEPNASANTTIDDEEADEGDKEEDEEGVPSNATKDVDDISGGIQEATKIKSRVMTRIFRKKVEEDDDEEWVRRRWGYFILFLPFLLFIAAVIMFVDYILEGFYRYCKIICE